MLESNPPKPTMLVGGLGVLAALRPGHLERGGLAQRDGQEDDADDNAPGGIGIL